MAELSSFSLPSSPTNFGASRLVPANLGKSTSPEPEKKRADSFGQELGMPNSKIWDTLGISIDSLIQEISS